MEQEGTSSTGGRITLVLGGANSGKSMYAQRLAKALAANSPLFYLATMAPFDGEDRARIEKHRREREGWGFSTLEIPLWVGGAAEQVRGGTVLLDSLTSLLTNGMFLPGGPGSKAEETLFLEILALEKTVENLVLVSDKLFSDGVLYEESTEAFRRQLGHLHQRLAARSDCVMELRYGLPITWKGADPLKKEAGA